jgi:hypothetical protein
VDVKKITDTFTLAVPVLIVCSCIRLITFYQRWNVPIFDYLSASELLLLFVQPLLVIAALATLYFASNVLLTGVMLLAVKWNTARGKGAAAPKADSPQQPETKYSIVAWGVVVVGLATIAFIFYNAIWNEFEIFPTLLLHVVLLAAIVGAVRQALPPAERESLIKPLVAATVVVLMSASFFYGRYQAHIVETHPTSLALALKDSGVLQTDANHIFLGKTSNYYFFHNTKDKETSIIPVGEVRATYIR